MRFLRPALLSLAFSLSLASSAVRAAELDLASATIADVQAAFAQGLTSEKLIQAYLARIEAYDQQGPKLNTVVTLNPKALAEARALDAERKAGKVRGPLHGIPVLLKDNVDTFDLPTTGGSQLLAGSIAPNDAFIVRKLRASGAIILAKVSLHEWAGGGGSVSGATDPETLRLGRVPNGFASITGQTRNPHDLTRGPAGSSSGTGSAIAASFAQFGIGTDTGGSVRNPSSANGIVGLKPTLGLLSRDGIIPLALSFDTAGPMARSVYDIAVSLNVMTGVDRADPATKPSKKHLLKDYTTALKPGALKGARIGVARAYMGFDADTDRVVEAALVTLRSLGAEIVDPVAFPDFVMQASHGLSNLVMPSEFKAQVTDYLKTTGPGFPKTFDEVVRLSNDPATKYRSPEKAFALTYTASVALDLDDPLFLAARDQGLALITAGVAAAFKKNRLDAIVYPTVPRPATLIEAGSAAAGAGSGTRIANQTRFPDLIVPAGMTKDGLPVTLSFLGLAWSEPQLLGYGHEFEQATKALRQPKFTPALPGDKLVY